MERDLSQQALAIKLCVDRSTVAGWEMGRRLPDATLIRRLSECLNVDIAMLMNAAGMDDENLNVIFSSDSMYFEKS